MEIIKMLLEHKDIDVNAIDKVIAFIPSIIHSFNLLLSIPYRSMENPFFMLL